jgi:hypothetical protein
VAAGLLGLSLHELDVRHALLSDDDQRAAWALTLPDVPDDARDELRERSPDRYRRLRARASRYRRQESAPQTLRRLFPFFTCYE